MGLTPEKAAPAAETPEMDAMPDGDAPFKSTAKAAVEADELSADEGSDEAKEIADAIEPGAGEDAEGDEEDAPQDEVEEILAEPEEKTSRNVQKRIDKLTAELRRKEAELETIRAQSATPDGKQLPEYTEDQLRKAMRKAIEEGDSDLVMDIQDYKVRKMEEKLVKMYQEEKTATSRQSQAIQREWEQVTDAYSKYADTKVPAVYPGSHKDLNLKDATSLLYQVATQLYWSEDPEKSEYYRKSPGGQKLAVADALTFILSKKAGKGNQKLKRQLAKERSKKSVVSGSPGGEEKAPRRAQSDTELLDEFISERKKYQEERGK